MYICTMKILRLKEILNEKGITGKQIASDLETTEATISNLSKGDSLPRKDMLINIAKYLDIDIRELLVSTKSDKSNIDLINDIKQSVSKLERRMLGEDVEGV